jgi:NTP pyrophosphatase (non-canonical NTP hydrolase)
MDNPTSIRNLSLSGFQGLNGKIYLVQNDQNFETADMVSRMHRYITQVLKAVRKGKTENIGFWLSMAFSWSLALANRLHIGLDEEMWKRFPGRCPYCGSPRCECKERAPARQEVSTSQSPIPRPATLRKFQEMFAKIYFYNTLQDATMHLAEEAGEVDEAIEHFMNTHDRRLFEDVITELVDAVTNMLAVATCLKLDLAAEMEKNFSDGCIRCHQIPCKCGFTVANSVSV